MQETAKVNYIQVWQIHKSQEGEETTVWCRGKWHRGRQPQGSKPVEKAKSLYFLQTPATDVGKADTKKHRTAKPWMQHAEDVERKDTMRRFASRGNAPHTL